MSSFDFSDVIDLHAADNRSSPLSRVLLIEEDPSEGQLIQHRLSKTEDDGRFSVEVVDCLERAKEQVLRCSFDVVLLDLDPRNGSLHKTIRACHSLSSLPIVVVLGAHGSVEDFHANCLGVAD